LIRRTGEANARKAWFTGTKIERRELRVQAGCRHDSMRLGLVAMLPRLKRFADLLAGDRQEGTALLRRGLIRMLSERHRYDKDTPLDRWAFAELYRRWTNEHRDQTDALTQAKPTEASFSRLLQRSGATELDSLTANFLWQLPPQQRSALLLVYGEGFDHETAAGVLGTTPDAIAARLIRASASLADRLQMSVPAQTHAAPAAIFAQEAARTSP
jgi:RNA polymerase sigma-70 factor (ECF subfamily)